MYPNVPNALNPRAIYPKGELLYGVPVDSYYMIGQHPNGGLEGRKLS